MSASHSAETIAHARPSLAAFTWACLKVGCLGFGGPAGQIALMHRVFVDEKKWIDEGRYLHALNYCMLLPGPEAQQLATYVGWLLHGVRGGVIAGALFVLPGALIVLGLSWAYAVHAQTPLMAALFYGVKAAVVAFMAEALYKVGKRALKRREHLLIAALAFFALFAFNAPFPLVILAAGCVGLMRARVDEPAAAIAPAPQRSAWGTAIAWSALWLAPLAASAVLLGPAHILTAVGVLFSVLALITFGGAYATLAYLQQQAVDAQGWLTQTQMIDGLGLAETTPGPLVLVNQYVGFLAGWQADDGGLALAVAAAAMASWCTFAPSFVWIFAGAPYAERLRASARARGALEGVTAAVLGVIASLALGFALHVLFTGDATIAAPWGARLPAPALTSFDPIAAGIALAAGAALIRFKANAALVVLVCAAAGVAVAFAL